MLCAIPQDSTANSVSWATGVRDALFDPLYITFPPSTRIYLFFHTCTQRASRAFPQSTSRLLNLDVSLSVEQHVCTATSHPAPQLFVSVSFLSPLLLTWWLLACPSRFGSSINTAARSCRLVLLCGQNSDPHCALPAEILQLKHSTHQRAAWLKIDSNSLFPFSEN